MNANYVTECSKPKKATLAKQGVATCRKLIACVEKVKDDIFAEFRGALAGQEPLLRLALNEAESLAWQSEFPHLVFPTLAMEKVQGVAAWSVHQQSIRRLYSRLSLAA